MYRIWICNSYFSLFILGTIMMYICMLLVYFRSGFFIISIIYLFSDNVMWIKEKMCVCLIWYSFFHFIQGSVKYVHKTLTCNRLDWLKWITWFFRYHFICGWREVNGKKDLMFSSPNISKPSWSCVQVKKIINLLVFMK